MSIVFEPELPLEPPLEPLELLPQAAIATAPAPASRPTVTALLVNLILLLSHGPGTARFARRLMPRTARSTPRPRPNATSTEQIANCQPSVSTYDRRPFTIR